MTADVATPTPTPRSDSTNYNQKQQQQQHPDGKSRSHPNKRKNNNARRRNTNNNNNNNNNNQHTVQAGSSSPSPLLLKDEKLCKNLTLDPRGDDPSRRMTKKKAGRNTESFDPASTLVRPALRVQVGSPVSPTYPRPLKHDDVVIVPELFGREDDKSLYYKLVEEMTELQRSNVKGSEWMSWHEGAHLIVKNPKGSKTFNDIIDKLCDYFQIKKQSIGTRFNWYTDSTDWKPFHHDSAAFNPQRAKTQNITVGVSFGATRELAFLRAPSENKDEKNSDCRLYFPQPNNGVFSFGRDVNIHWKHGINALPEDIAENDDNKNGRISIILWGLAQNVIEEEGSPPLLGADGQGPHAASKNNKFHGNKHNNKNWRRNNNGRNDNKGGNHGGNNNNHNGKQNQGQKSENPKQ